jgi:hypothetical protein
MVKKVTGYRTENGEFFLSVQEAEISEAKFNLMQVLREDIVAEFIPNNVDGLCTLLVNSDLGQAIYEYLHAKGYKSKSDIKLERGFE